MILETIEQAFRQGCRLTLADAVKSARFSELSQAQDTLYERHSAESDLGVALRAGHLVMGQLLNTTSESEALFHARHIRPPFGVGTECRALVTYLGEQLVESAGRCLPQEIKKLAANWKKTDVEGQIQIGRQLWDLF